MSHLDLNIDIPATAKAKAALNAIQHLADKLSTEALAVNLSGNMSGLEDLQTCLRSLNCQHAILALDNAKATAAIIHAREQAAIAEHGDLA